MRKAGALTENEAPSSSEASDGLEMLNDLIGSWSNDSMKIYVRSLESFPLTTAYEYTIGTGATFNTTRPVQIVSAYIRDGSTDYELTQKSDEDYARIQNKSLSGIPFFFNYDYGYPTGKIKLYPAPQGYTLFLLMEKELSGFSTLNEEVSLPPGWERALKYNLAVELAPEFGAQLPPEVSEIARTSKGAIQRAIIKNKSMDVPSYGRFGNIYTGWQ